MTPEARYDAIAEWYPGFAAAFGESEAPFPAGFFGEVSGLRVLDVACGQGRTSRALARRGATVVGVDLSGRLIDLAVAEEAASPLGIEYVVGDAAGSTDFGAASFDLAVCNMSLSDIDDLGGLGRNLATWLRPGGRFAAVIIHPCFPGTPERPPSWPPDGYFREGWWTSGDLENGGIRARVGANHRMVSTYLNTFIEAGFRIDRVEEPVWLPGLPGFFAIRCIRD